MASWGFAPKFTRMTFSGTGTDNAVQVENGEPVRVWGYIITKNPTPNGNDNLFIQSGDGTITYDDLVVVGGTTTVFDVPWIADKGIRCYVTDGAAGNATEIQVTFFHSHPGS